MYRTVLRLLCVLVFAGGFVLHVKAARPRPAPAVAPDPRDVTSGGGEDVAREFEIDVYDVREKLGELRQDERREQIADWTVLGTLLRQDIDPQHLRDLAYDRVPFRHPALEEVFEFDYGEGRRVIAGEDAWLFYPLKASARRTTILGRLADQVRMETGRVPGRVRIFGYASELTDGMIRVREEREIQGSSLFSPSYGYVEASVGSAAELGKWLSSIDEVSHMRLESDGRVTCGGRRFAEARTENVTLEDVAALYQAQSWLAAEREKFEARVMAASKPLADAYEAAVNEYNACVTRHNSGRTVDTRDLRSRIERLETLLGRTSTPASKAPTTGSKEPVLQFDGNELLGKYLARRLAGQDPVTGQTKPLGGLDADELYKYFAQGGSVGRASLGGDLDEFREQIEQLEPLIKPEVERLQTQALAKLMEEGKVAPDEPGFSLDPQWDVEALIADFERLVNRPHELVAEARAIQARDDPRDADPKAQPYIVKRASQLDTACQGLSDEQIGRVLRPEWRSQIEKAVRSVKGKSRQEAEKGALLPMHLLLEELKQSDDNQALQARSLLKFIEAKDRSQSARYDGPLQGTRVGMVLFYTDLVAKLWVSTDYYGSAPGDDEVFGFHSQPRTGAELEPEYWEEEWKYPATRLWFGTKAEGYSSDPDAGSVSFSHISTRVYSAGSNDLRPGEETTAAESSRRAFGWWDRHYTQVADFEPQYHVQNQIMKWSVLTSWLREQKRFEDLKGVKVDRSLRFDRWYAASDDLRFHRDVRFLPEEKWPGAAGAKLETIEILCSYPFPSAGKPSIIYGGVSLGSARSLEIGPLIKASDPPALLRRGLRLDPSAPGKLSFLKGSVFELPEAASPARSLTRVVPAPTARLRAGPAVLKFEKLTAEIASESGTKRIGLATDAGELGELSATTRGATTHLGWKRGGLEADQALVARMSERLLAGPELASDSLSGASDLLADSGTLIVERGATLEIVRAPLGEGAGSAVRSLEASLDASAYPARASAADMLGSRVRVVAEPLAPEGLASKLAGCEWQRLRPARGQLRSDVPRRVERVFTDRAPGPDAVPLAVDAPGSLGRLDGFVEDGALYLKRPAGVSVESFAKLVDEHALTSRVVGDIIATARVDGAVASLPARVRAVDAVDVGRSVFEHVEAGRVSDALDEFASAAQAGELEGTVSSFRAATREAVVDGLRRGARNAVAQRFAAEAIPVLGPDATLLRALEGGSGATGSGVVQRLHAAFAEGTPSVEAIRLAESGLHARGLHSAADYVRLRGGLDEAISAGVADKIDLVFDGRPRTQLELPLGKRSRTLKPSDRPAPVRDIYVSDLDILAGFDWDAAPGHTLAKLRANPRIQWESVRVDGLGSFRPDRIGWNGRTFHRRTAVGSGDGDGFRYGGRILLARHATGGAGSGGGDDDDDDEDEDEDEKKTEEQSLGLPPSREEDGL